MKKIKFFALAVLTGAVLLSGCNESKRNVYEQACKDLDQNYYQYALDGFQEVIDSGELLPQSHRGIGIAYLRMGRYSDAVNAFSSALRFEKQGKAFYRDVLFYRATAYAQGKKYDQALADCETLRTEYTVDTNTYFLTGLVVLNMDSYDEAEDYFDRAYAANPSYELALRIYQVYVDKGMEADGTRYLERALENQPKTTQDYCDRGRVYYYMGDYERAKSELTTSSNNGNQEAILLLGMVYQELGDVSNARSMYNQYLTQVGESAKGYNGLAQCDILEDKYQDALANIAKGLEFASTEEMQDLMHNEIVVYERQRDFATALEKAENYMNLFPDDKVIRREIVFLESRTGNGAAQRQITVMEPLDQSQIQPTGAQPDGEPSESTESGDEESWDEESGEY